MKCVLAVAMTSVLTIALVAVDCLAHAVVARQVCHWFLAARDPGLSLGEWFGATAVVEFLIGGRLDQKDQVSSADSWAVILRKSFQKKSYTWGMLLVSAAAIWILGAMLGWT